MSLLAHHDFAVVPIRSVNESQPKGIVEPTGTPESATASSYAEPQSGKWFIEEQVRDVGHRWRRSARVRRVVLEWLGLVAASRPALVQSTPERDRAGQDCFTDL